MIFQPWIGENYFSGYQCDGARLKRTLILGESYYEKDPVNNPLSNRPDLTTRIIQQQINCKWIHPFYTKIATVFLGHPPSRPERGQFWNSVAYYVFIQDIVGSRAQQRPTKAMWRAGCNPFLSVLQQRKPEFVLVCGKTLWNWLPVAKNNQWTESAEKGRCAKDRMADGSAVLFCGIMHPSAWGFSPNAWHPFVASAMKSCLKCDNTNL